MYYVCVVIRVHNYVHIRQVDNTIIMLQEYTFVNRLRLSMKSMLMLVIT